MSRVNFMGVPIDALNLDQTVDKVLHLIDNGESFQHVCINPGKVIRMMEDPEVRQTIRRCEVISADGIGVVWMAKLLDVPIPERVAGIDLMDRLLGACAFRGYKPFFLGAKPEVLEAAVKHYQIRFPKLKFAGWRDGYFSDQEAEGVANQIAKSGAHMLFVAISSPKKEQFLGRYRDRMQVPFCMGVGGSFDVKAGKVKRAPKWMQRVGLEWSYRFLQEPKRMLRRNAVDTPKFLALALAAKLTGLEIPD